MSHTNQTPAGKKTPEREFEKRSVPFRSKKQLRKTSSFYESEKQPAIPDPDDGDYIRFMNNNIRM